MSAGFESLGEELYLGHQKNLFQQVFNIGFKSFILVWGETRISFVMLLSGLPTNNDLKSDVSTIIVYSR